MTFDEHEMALLKDLRGGRYKPVRGEDEKAANRLHRRVPCLVAMGPDPDPIVCITEPGKEAYDRAVAEAAKAAG